MAIYEMKDETTCQLTSFRVADRYKVIHIPRGQKVPIGEVSGSGVITQFWLTFPGWFFANWDPQQIVSQTIFKTIILRIFWDGEVLPAVEAPVGDFFGVGLCEPGNFTSQYFGMSSGGFYCKFPMPFQKGFRIEMENGDETVDTVVFVNVLYQLKETLLTGAGYFHAQFHTGRLQGSDAMLIAQAEGSGHYAGCTLSMQGSEKNYFSFLEAPEYIYVDEDWEEPRIVGTGLEDYFLGGWYFREGAFAGPLHGVPVKDQLNSCIAMYRVHDADAIRFKKRLRFTFLNPWEAQALKPYCYSSVAFLYLESPKGLGNPLPARDELLCWYRIRQKDHADKI